MYTNLSLRCALVALVSSTIQMIPDDKTSDSNLKKTPESLATAAEIRKSPEVIMMNEKVESSESAGSALAKMQSCVTNFAPFPEKEADNARNRFIVDLAYESGCDLDDQSSTSAKSCKSQILSMQKLTDVSLNEKCSQTTFPDMCGGCLTSKNLREKKECGLMSQTERKNTIVSELQRLEANTTVMPEAVNFQHMSPDALIETCTAKTFTDWCQVLTSCGAPPLRNCAKLSQQDKKNTFIYLALMSEQGMFKPTEAQMQAETDKALQLGCTKMSLIQPSLVEVVETKVAKEREERLAALEERRANLEKFAGF